MSLLIALGGAGPAPDEGLPWQVVDWLVVEEEDEDATWISAIIEAAFVVPDDPVFASCATDDDEVEEFTDFGWPIQPPLNEVEDGYFDVVEEPEDDLHDVLAAIVEDVAAATEFIKALTEVDIEEAFEEIDDGLFGAGWNAAFDSPEAPPLTPSPPSLGAGSFMGTYPRGEQTPKKDQYNEEEELELSMIAVTIIRNLS